MKAITSLKDLHAFVRSLNTEISRVWEHWTVLKGIHQLANEYWLEVNESREFWQIASRALQDTVIIRLGAAIDTSETVVSMPKLLRLLQKQLNPRTSFFTVPQQEALHCADIDKDIDDTDAGDTVVNKVRKHRDKLIAHREMSIIVNNSLHELPELPDAEIEGLIVKLNDMVFKYIRIIGMRPIRLGCPDDYKSLFKLLRTGFDAGHPGARRVHERKS